MIIAIDFDGTCVEHEYPRVGPDVPHAERVIRRLADAGHFLILYTMRDSNLVAESKHGSMMADARAWFLDRKLPLVAINANAPGGEFSSSRKVYAHIYIDDAALGCPMRDGGFGARPMVDWLRVETWLVTHGVVS